MDVIVVISVFAGLVGIVAGIVQVVQYIQDRKEKAKDFSANIQKPIQNEDTKNTNLTHHVIARANKHLKRHQEPNLSLIQKIERQLRMKKYHWIKAGFSIPSENFNFTAIYFDNQLEVLQHLQTHIRLLIKLLKGKQVNPSHPKFFDEAYEMLDEIDSRTSQIDEVLKYEKDHPLSIFAQKALQNFSQNSTLFRKQLVENSMSGILEPNETSEFNRELVLQLRTLEISGQELQKHLRTIFKFANTTVSAD